MHCKTNFFMLKDFFIKEFNWLKGVSFNVSNTLMYPLIMYLSYYLFPHFPLSMNCNPLLYYHLVMKVLHFPPFSAKQSTHS